MNFQQDTLDNSLSHPLFILLRGITNILVM